jgi:hypothetical protein
MKKIISIGLVAVILMGLVGCASVPEDPARKLGNNLEKSQAVIADNQKTLEQNQPAPKIAFSNERANLIKRAVTFNEPNKLSYIYLFTKAGTIAGFYTVKGKVSNLSSYLVPDQQIADRGYSYSQVVQAPDIDGSYGTNGEGIFFYTADGTYCEWNGEYMLVDQPLKVTTQPVLVQQTK